MQSTCKHDAAARREQVEKLLEGMCEAPDSPDEAEADAVSPAPVADSAPQIEKSSFTAMLKRHKGRVIAVFAVVAVLIAAAVLIPTLIAGPHSSPYALGHALETACQQGDAAALADLIGMDGGEAAFDAAWSEVYKNIFIATSFVPSFGEFSAVSLYFVDSVVGEHGDFAVLYLCDRQGQPSPVYAYKTDGKWFVRQNELFELLVWRWRSEHLAK